MKTGLLTSLMTAISLAIVLTILGCASMQSNWENALSYNTIEAYEKFVNNYPNSVHAREARVMIRRLEEDRDLKIALRRNSIQTYEEFIARYQDSMRYDEINSRLDTMYYDKAKVLNTIEAYESFLQRKPEGKLAEEIKVTLKTLKNQLKNIEEAARVVLPNEAEVTVKSISRYPQQSDFVISAHLLEGRSTNDANPYVQGDYGTHEKLIRLVRLRCATVLKSVFTRTVLPAKGRIIIDACHGVRQSTVGDYSRGTDVPMTIYKISLSLGEAKMQQWSKMKVEAIMDLWSVDENIIPSLQFSKEP
jgi:hypothetical protein